MMPMMVYLSNAEGEQVIPGPVWYAAAAIAGVILSAWVWSRILGRRHADGRLTIIYFAAIVGAIVGAKVAFLFAEGWNFRDDWMVLLTGRSVTGALLGGYLGVEWAKRALQYQSATGDFFAIVAPLSLAIGRLGCLANGCCLGRPCESAWWTMSDAAGVERWPAVPVELLFNVAFAAWAMLAWRRGWLPGNRFHVYLMAYGTFRFAHEFLRNERPMIGPLTGYHIIALVIAVVGLVMFLRRKNQPSFSHPCVASDDTGRGKYPDSR